FTSQDIQTIPPTADTYAEDATVPPGPPVQKMAPHTGYVTQVFKIWLRDGKEYDRKLFDTATYKPSGAVWGYNPTTPPTAQLAAASAAASAAAAASPSASAN
ncbi:MAG: hypothetical protein WCP73_06180, partial [Eubacteriales bacterium]